MGRGALAVECAEILRREGHELAGVISTDGKIAAWAARERILRLDGVGSPEARELLAGSDYLFSIINGEILDADTLALPRRLAVNYHNGPLPKYAGVHATSWAILNGEDRHGVTWHVMTPRIDAGDVLCQVEFPIGERDTALTLNLACHEHAIASFAQLVAALASGEIARRPQDTTRRTYFAGRLRHPSRGLVSWEMTAEEIDRVVRAHTLGASPNALGLPLAPLGDEVVIVSELALAQGRSGAAPGTVVATGTTLRVATATDDVEIGAVRRFDGETLHAGQLGFALGASLDAGADRIEAWRRLLTESNANEKAWHACASGVPLTSLPIAWPGPPATPQRLSLDAERASRWDAPAEHVLLAALFVYLGRYTAASSIAVDVSTARMRRAAEGLAPLALGRAPLRVEVDGSAPFAASLAAVRASLGRLEALGPCPRDLPLRYPSRDLPLACPISVVLDEGGLVFSAASSAVAVSRVGEHVISLLEDAERDPQKLAARLDGRPPGELAPDAQRVDFDDPPPWTALERWPAEAIAVISGEARLSYGELRRRASQIAAELASRGVKECEPVAVLLPRSIDLPAALFAVLRLGATYVPLDPAWPDARWRFIANDCGARVVVTTEALASRVEGEAILVERVPAHPHAVPVEPARLAPESVAYVMYTSGSTGKPKGVACTWAGLRNRLAWSQAAYPIQASDALLQTAAVGFDISVWEILFPLASGATLVVAHHEEHDASAYLVETVLRERVTFAHFVPSLLRSLLDGVAEGVELPLRVVVCGGEALTPALRDAFFARSSADLFHAYGPTEASISVTHWSCRDRRWPDRVPLGEAIANVIVDVRDSEQRAIPFGITGEIVLGGVALARGYVGEAAEGEGRARFLADPERPGERIYLTGDLGVRLPDGTLEFVGRRDQQLKIRGHRVEPGEVEAVLAQAPGVARVVVAGHVDARGQASLVAHVETAATSPRALREWLAARLPRHMIPAQWALSPSLPTSPNGKIDRRALPVPTARGRDADVPFAAPRGPLEETLAAGWMRVLGIDEIGRDDDFLALGGDSLQATRLLAWIANETGVRLTLRDVFAHPSIAGLARRIESQATAARTAPIPRLAPGAKRPLALAQERVWFLEELHGPGMHNVPFAWRITGHVDARALATAFACLAERHEVLRSGVRRGDDGLEAMPAAPPSLEVRAVAASAITDELVAFADRPFDLAEAPWRASLWRASASESVLALVVHHIAADRWSMNIAMGELAVLYDEARSGRGASLAPVKLAYADYAAWQRALPASEWAADLDYWRAALAGVADRLDWPATRTRREARGARLRTELDAGQAGALRRHAERSGTTLQMLLLATYQLLLRRLTGQDDIAVGLPVANRERLEVQSLVGLMTNTVALRVRCEPTATFETLLARVRDAVLDATAHQEIPFNEVVAALRPERAASQSGLLSTMFVFYDKPQTLLLGEARAEPLATGTSFAMFDLTLMAEDRGGAIALEWEYASSLFDRAVIARFAEGLGALADEILAMPSRPLSAFVWQLAPAAPLPVTVGEAPDKTIVRAFVEQASRSPDAIAIVSVDRPLTYRELDGWSNRIARALRKQGVDREDIVAVHLDRSPELIATLLGVLKAGAAYLPLDPSDPPLRKRDFASQARANVVVTSEAFASEFGARSWSIGAAVAESSDALSGEPALSDLAYVVFTSGSTGRPKGVLIEHSALANYVDAASVGFALSSADRVVQFASIGFDAAAEEIWPTLCSGAGLVLRDDDMLSPVGLFDACVRRGVTVLDLPTAYWNSLAADLDRLSVPPLLRLVIVGGERLLSARVTAWRRWLAHHGRTVRLLNTYGPTEATIVATWYEVDRDPEGEVPIGRPVRGASARVLGERRRVVPGGAVGELALSGVGLARGYLSAPESTAERFVVDGEGTRLYLTGDRVRMRMDGELEFVGRADDQVKVRGFRVELCEIESVLSAHPDVRDLGVVVDDDRILAFVVTGDLASVDAFARERLPSYMLPRLVATTSIPRLASGKVDRASLKARGVRSQVPPSDAATPVEGELVAIFAETLRLPSVSVDADFFAAGGHSLLAIDLVGRIRKRLGIDVPMRLLFDHPTVSALASRLPLEGRYAPLPRLAVRRLPLSPSQLGIWIMSKLAPALYNVPVALEIDGRLDEDALRRAIDSLVARHEALRTRILETDGEVLQEVGDVGARLEIAEGGSGAVRAIAERPFDFRAGPPVRFVLLRASPGRHVFVIVAHHVLVDGLSIDVVLDDLDAFYRGDLRPEVPAQALDVLAWEAALRQTSRDRSLAYWKTMLGGLSAFERPRASSYGAGEVEWCIPGEVAGRLREIAASHQATLSMALLAAWQELLFADGGEEVVVGTPIGARLHPDAVRVVGPLVDVAPVRARLGAETTFVDALRHVRTQVLGATEHRGLAVDELREIAGLPRAPGAHPLFRTMFSLEERVSRALGDLTAREVAVAPEGAKFDLELAIRLENGVLVCALRYASDVFDAASVAGMASRFTRLVDHVLADPSARLRSLSLLDEADRERLLAWGDGGPPASREPLPVHLSRVRDREAVAISSMGRDVRYGELEARVARLASLLSARGVRKGDRVVVHLDRSLELVVSLLAIWRAGAVYVPLATHEPASRVARILDDCAPRLVLTDREGLATSATVVRPGSEDLDPSLSIVPAVETAPDDVAYVIFTSGSTGKPKGVECSHAGIANRVLWSTSVYPATPQDSLLQIAAIGFDISLWEILFPLVCGGRLVIPPPGRPSIEGLVEIIERERIRVVHFVPSLLEAFLENAEPARCRSLALVVCGGDRVPPSLRERVLAKLGADLHHAYGPTEASISVTHFDARRGGHEGALPLGRPIAGARLYVLGSGDRLAAPSVVGELHISGIPLARGYLGDEVLTAQRFVPDPFFQGERMYRTGDRARWLPDGQLEFLGRADDQVKIRGFRVELGEIEAVLREHPAAESVAVVAPQDDEGRPVLVAYVVARAASSEDLRAHLEARLAEAMRPRVVFVDALPMLSSGKVDRRALAERPLPPVAPDRASRGAPRTREERVLAAIWCELLKVDDVGPSDDFFLLGGDSVAAIRMVARARARGLVVDVRQIFATPTLEALARAVRPALDPLPSSAAPPLTPSQRAFFADPPEDVHHFNQAIVLQTKKRLDAHRLEVALRRVVAHHDALRLRFHRSGEEWRASVAPPEEGASVAFASVRLATEAEWRAAVAITQTSLDIERGPLAMALFAELGDTQRLLLAVHHLAIDGVSWNIVIDDLAVACDAADLPPATPFSAYAEALALTGVGEGRDADLVADAALPLARADAKCAFGWTCDAEVTSHLLREARRRRTTVEQLLLTALASALAETADRASRFVVLREAHARDLVAFDTSRTVGWIAVETALVLDARDLGRDLGSSLPASNELRRRAELRWNYLGDLTEVASPLFDRVDVPCGSTGIARTRRGLDVSAEIAAGVLRIEIASLGFEEGAVGALADRWRTALDGLVGSEARDDRDDDAFPLAPLQAGLLWHGLVAPASGQYHTQMLFELVGTVDEALLEEAWQATAEHLACFRTRFVWEGVESPLQVVARHARMPWRRVSVGDDDPARLDEILSSDLAEPFRFDEAPLSRLVSITAGARRFLLWSHHHILLDGWSLPIVLRTVALAYASRRAGEPPALPASPRYADYVAWLGKRDVAAAEHFWRDALAGAEPSLLCSPGTSPVRSAGTSSLQRTRVLRLDGAETAALRSAAERGRATLHSVVASAWALLLRRRLQRSDVTFGVVVSIRPDEVPGVEGMVGLLMNTLPMRLQMRADHDVWDLVRSAQSTLLDLLEHGFVPLSRVLAWAEQPNLFDTLVVFESYPGDRTGQRLAPGESLAVARVVEPTEYPLVLTVLPDEALGLDLTYDALRIDDEEALALGDRLLRLLRQLAPALAKGTE